MPGSQSATSKGQDGADPAVHPYLQERNEEEEGVGCPPELGVEEAWQKREHVVFRRARNEGDNLLDPYRSPCLRAQNIQY